MTTADTPAPGSIVGGFRIGSLLGDHGMRRVYRAQSGDGGEVVVKLVKAEIASDPVFRRRFERESRNLARVVHPSVVPIIAVGEHEGIPFLAQPYIAGGSLEQRIRGHGPLPLEHAAQICLEIGGGLDALHALGLIHRDVKPGNIVLDEQGHAYITDFGLAKDRNASLLTQPGHALGSLDYMAPEQIRTGEVTGASDIYALGCVMYECLSGAPPFGDREGMRVLWGHLQDSPPDLRAIRSDLSDEVVGALNRALEKEPENRPRTATAYARAVLLAAGMTLSPGGNG